MKRLLLLLVICSFSLYGQRPDEQLTPPVLLNIGIKAGPAAEFARPVDNSLGIYAADHGLFDMRTYNLAADAQLFRLNGMGGALEAGFRKNQGDFALHQNSRLFSGEGYSGFARRSLYLKPSMLYNHMLGERWILLASAGAEFHKNLDGGTQVLYQETYSYESPGYYSILSGGLEIRTWLNQILGLSFYANYLYGLQTTGEVFHLADREGGELVKIGEYRGSGLDLGFRLSLCFSCKE